MRSDLRRRFLVAALGAAALAALGPAWLARDVASAPAPRPAAAAAEPVAARAPATAARVLPLADAAVPPGVTADQWRALQAELGARPEGAAEIRRIADYLAWADLLRRLRESAAAPQADGERRRLAYAVQAGLPARLDAGEVSAAEARQIEAAILEQTVPDEAERAAALQRWIAAHAAGPRPDPRQAAFERRQAEIVAAWSAQAPEARQRAALERELESLRREHFAVAPAHPTGGASP